MRLKILSCLFVLLSLANKKCISQKFSRECYQRTFDTLKVMLDKDNGRSFKKAVFLTENTFYADSLKFEDFEAKILSLVGLAREWQKANRLLHYKRSDSINVQKNFSLFTLLKDTVKVSIMGNVYGTQPYNYDFDDFLGQQKWQNMFVTKLLKSQKGNCHSMPYLYKILADELGAKCWLSIAPNHIYIKNRSSDFGWYNTELTTGTFPIDSWIMASGYLPLQSIQNGIYMDTLSNQQSIALCVLDLAKGYEHQAKNYEDGFILKCCDLSLKYFPKNVQAMLLKAETLKQVYESQQAAKRSEAKATYEAMEKLYVELFDLGYREMPDKMYLDWLRSVNNEKGKYQNKQVKKTVTGTK